MQLATRYYWTIIIIFVLMFSMQVMAAEMSMRNSTHNEIIAPEDGEQNAGLLLADYIGTARISIIEPSSRWKDSQGHAYENAHIWWALNKAILIPDGGVWDTTISWTGSGQFSNVSADNIAAVGFLCTSTYEICDAYPPNGAWFAAYYADASATARPGLPGTDYTDIAGYTHSVLVEEATATW